MPRGQPKKILFVITKSVWGGAQKYVYDLATNIPRDAFEPVVALGGYGPLAEKLRTAGVEIYTIKNFQRDVNPLKDMLAFFELVQVLRRVQPAIVHANSSKAGGIAALAARCAGLSRPRIIFTVHGWGFHEPRSRWQLFLRRCASQLTARLSDTIITVSDYDRDSAIQRRIAPADKLITIPVGISDISLHTKADARRRLFGATSSPVVGVIAEWTRNKGLDVFIEAWGEVTKQVPNAHACFIGWGEEEENLKKNIAAKQLQNSVLMKTVVLDAAAYIKAFDIFVLPSRKEGMPYTILEAGAANVPVIATRVGGVPEILENNVTGLLVAPESPPQLAEAIIALLKNPDRRSTLAQRLHEIVGEKFTKAQMIEKTLTVYFSLP